MNNAQGELHPNGYCKHMVRLDHKCTKCLMELVQAEREDRTSRINAATTREEVDKLVAEFYPNGLPEVKTDG